MRNIKLVIEYDGTNYHGWQVQANALSIQEVIETKLGIMIQEQVRVIASGRTDTGVHALGQVAIFKTSSSLPVDVLRHGLNRLLPEDIVIQSAVEVDEYFHPQFGAKRKTYRYVILNRERRSALHRNYSWHLPRLLDLAAMRDASSLLMGKQDFSSFQAADPDPADPVREVFKAEWSVEEKDFFIFTIEADGFLKHMVRNIVGTLVEIGRGRISREEFSEILRARDRRRAGMTAPPRGLFLLEVKY